MKQKLKMPVLGLDDICRFWQYVQKLENGCWIWIGSKAGAFEESWRRPLFKIKSTSYVASRISYWIHYRQDPEEKEVCHDCSPNPDDPLCIRPEHLWLGSHQENAQDHFDKGGIPSYGRQKLHDSQFQEIKELYDRKIPVKEISRLFGIDRQTVYQITHKRIG